MSDTSKEIFLSRRLEEYESQMLLQWDKIKNVSELSKWHIRITTEIIARISETWKNEMGALKFPADLYSTLPSRFNQNLDKLKIHYFTKSTAPTPMVPKFTKPETIPRKTFTENRKGSTSIPESKPDYNNNHSTSTREYVLGIDLGTTMCCVGIMYNGKVEIVENRSQGSYKTTPSYVNLKENNSRAYGYAAKNQAYRYPESTIYDAKRMIGRSWQDESLQNNRKLWLFEVIEEYGNPKVIVGLKTYYPQEISGILLSQLRDMSEECLQVPKTDRIRKVVVTVPAYFTTSQRKATKDAADIAGLQVLQILSEPTAAAIAYKWENKFEGTRKVLIYDLGGGTFDVSIAIVKQNVEILCVRGHTNLGGRDFDELLVDYCLDKFKIITGLDVRKAKQSHEKRIQDNAKRALGRLRRKCEISKEILSSGYDSAIDVDSFFENHDLLVEIRRETLESLCKPLVQKTMEIVQLALEDAKEKGINGKNDIDDVILAGGSTRMPLVQNMLQEFFDGKMLFKRINPDEIVAFGAAIQAEALKFTNPTDDKSLGIECEPSIFADDYQTQLEFAICQGNGSKASENLKLGEFVLKGIPASSADIKKTKVTMSLDPKGNLHVKSVGLKNGESRHITISSSQLGI